MVATVALAASLGLVGCSTSSESTDSSDDTSSEITASTVEEWYEENFYGKTLTGAVEGVESDGFGVIPDDGLTTRPDGEVIEGFALYYVDEEELDDDTYPIYISDDTTFSYADGTEATQSDVEEGDVVTVTFSDSGAVESVVIAD